MVVSTVPESAFDGESFINEYYGAWSGADEDDILSYYTDNVVLQIPGTLMHGKEALRDQFVRPFITAFPGNRHLVRNMILAPGRAIVEFNFEARHQGSFAGHAATGAQINVPGCGVYEFDPAKRQITAARMYFDVGTLLQTITEVPSNDPQKAAKALHLVEDGLRTNEFSWRQIIDNIPGLVATMSPRGEVEFLNQRTLEYFGKTTEELKNWSLLSAVHPEDLPRVIKVWQKSIEAGQIYEVEHRCRRADGLYRWFKVRGLPVLNAEGTITAWYLLLTDIEDLKKAEEALQANERNLSLTINTIPTMIAVLAPEGTVLSSNQAALDYHGVTMEDVQKEDFRTRFYHPDDFERLREELMEAPKRLRQFEYELRALSKEGEYRWFLVRHNPLLDEQGGIVRWYVTAFDIEDRKRSEEDLRRSEAFLAETQTLSSIGSFLWRVRPDEITWSEETYRIFELDQGVPVTLDLIASRVHPDDLPLMFEMIDRVRNEASDFEYEHRLLLPDHSVKHVHMVAHGRRDRDGQLEYIGAVQDVTESKAAEEALTRARSELAHMARVTTLSALTASIAHEINQPISAVITSADACLRWLNRDQPEVQRARDAAMRIEDDGRRAAEIIDHLKSFYKKDVSPQRKMVSVNDLVGEMLVLLRSEADRHSVVMRTELAADLPSVSADRVQLQQVLMNLMLNAMEATNEGGGEVKISTRRKGGEVMVSVSDTGMGIPADKMAEIFNQFFTTKPRGTGMGLAISGTIIESHGGRLWATANPGPGATFHFTLPTQPEALSDR